MQPIERALRYAELSSELASRAAKSFYSPDEIAIFDVRKWHDVLVFTEESRSVCRRQRQVGARHGTIRPLRRCAEVFHALKSVLKERGLSTAVGDEGGFAPNLDSIEDALDCILKAIERAGYRPGDDVRIAMDCASSEFCREENGQFVYDYTWKDPKGRVLTAEEQVAFLEKLVDTYPNDSIEDGMSENDWAGWKALTERLGGRCQLVGDDLFVTNVDFLARGI